MSSSFAGDVGERHEGMTSPSVLVLGQELNVDGETKSAGKMLFFSH